MTSDALKMPIFADANNAASPNARSAMNSDIVKMKPTVYHRVCQPGAVKQINQRIDRQR